MQGFFSQIVRLAESGIGSKTPKQGKRPVGHESFFKTHYVYMYLYISYITSIKYMIVVLLSQFGETTYEVNDTFYCFF